MLITTYQLFFKLPHSSYVVTCCACHQKFYNVIFLSSSFWYHYFSKESYHFNKKKYKYLKFHLILFYFGCFPSLLASSASVALRALRLRMLNLKCYFFLMDKTRDTDRILFILILKFGNQVIFTSPAPMLALIHL